MQKNEITRNNSRSIHRDLRTTTSHPPNSCLVLHCVYTVIYSTKFGCMGIQVVSSILQLQKNAEMNQLCACVLLYCCRCIVKIDS